MNFASISNPAYDAAVTKASGLTGEDACAAWADAESEIIKANSAVPFADKITTLYFNNAGLAFGRNFIGSAAAVPVAVQRDACPRRTHKRWQASRS